MKVPKSIKSAVILLCCLSSCSTGKIILDKTTSFSVKKERIEHIISINPNFGLPATLDSKLAKEKPKLTEKDAFWFYNSLKFNAKKQGIYLQIEGAKEAITVNDANYFNYLAPLKREMLAVMQLKDFGDLNKKFSSTKAIKEYPVGIDISTKNSHLAEKYGTKYFALQGISFIPKTENTTKDLLLATNIPSNQLAFITNNAEAVYYTIIADVTNAEIVYREFRKIKINTSQKQFNAIIEDSFELIND
jgi:hypothetical protein